MLGRSVITKLILLAVPLTLAAAGGLWHLNRQAYGDAMLLATSASAAQQALVGSATRQAADMVEQAGLSARLVDEVRSLQLHFQRQVLAFKNLIVRGERPDQHEVFIRAFEQHQAAVTATATNLAALFSEKAMEGRIHAFIKAHGVLTASYRNAWAMIDLAETWSDGLHRADDYMVGRDSEPTRMLDELTRDILASAASRLATQQHDGEQVLLMATRAGEAELQQAVEATRLRNQRLGVITLSALILGVAILLFLAHRRLRPLRAAATALNRLAEGNLEDRLSVTSADEFGQLALSFNRSLEALTATLGTARVDWATFGASRRGAAQRLGADLARTTLDLSQAGSSGADAATAVDAHARHLASQVRTIGSGLESTAAGVEELTASLATVAASAQRADDAVSRTHALATNAGKSLEEFRAAALKVGEATHLIAHITRQVNLLALNATIESARAGEHGRGFTVVAQEVKAMARQTADATEEISSRISSMQAVGERTAKEVQAIDELMRQAAETVREVSNAVEQQVATTREMASVLSRSATEGQALQKVVGDLERISATSSAAAESTRQAAQGLERLASDLRLALGSSA
jgi:methyl-accepting chemotaxis protein